MESITASGTKVKPRTIFHLTFYVDPSNSDAFLKSLRQVHNFVTAEPLCLWVDVLRDQENPGNIRLIEEWDCDKEYFVNVRFFSEAWRLRVLL